MRELMKAYTSEGGQGKDLRHCGKTYTYARIVYSFDTSENWSFV